jgi:hypothetical protein
MPSPSTSRPRRATKPTSRRAAAAPPSSAPPPRASASKVSKRAQTTAVTAGLVGRGGGRAAARAKSVPAVQKDVVEKDVAPEPVQQPAPVLVFRYSAQWSLRHVRDTSKAIQADLEHQSSNATDEAITKANAFLDRGTAEEMNCKLMRKQLSAGYYGLAQANWIEGSFTPSAYSALVEHIREWHAQGKTSLVIKVVALMGDVTMDDTEASGEPEPTTAAAAANTSRVRNTAAAAALGVVALGVRDTATNRAIARQPSEQREMEVGGNRASSITARWSCSQRSCANYQRGSCYWTGRDEPTYHVPVIAPVLTA